MSSTAEASGRPLTPDVEEVVNYVGAIEQGIDRLRCLPLSVRLVCEMHSVILAGVRGSERRPGEIRQTQNWIGTPDATVATARFVPPPPDELSALLTDLELFIHDSPQLPPLVQAALVHYQFETIHPFLDGNGRLGRLLIIFFLIQRGRLQTPLLYLSSYFEAHRQTYYDTLQGVRESGNVEAWLNFFLRGVEVQAGDAITRSERLMDLREHYRQAVRGRHPRRTQRARGPGIPTTVPQRPHRGGPPQHHPTQRLAGSSPTPGTQRARPGARWTPRPTPLARHRGAGDTHRRTRPGRSVDHTTDAAGASQPAAACAAKPGRSARRSIENGSVRK